MASPQVTKGKDRLPTALRYDALQQVDFAGPSINQPIGSTGSITVGPLQNTASIAGSLVVPFNTKALAVAIYAATVAIPSICLVNVVLGSVANIGPGTTDNRDLGVTPPTVLSQGNSLFVGDQPIGSAGGMQAAVIYATTPNFDGIFPAGGVITLRVSNPLSTIIPNVYATLAVKSYDVNFTHPQGTTTDLSFNPQNDL